MLLVSAALKSHATLTEPYFADSILGSPFWMLALIECEILLALWLFSGVMLRAASWATFLAFVGFAAVNVYLLATGATTCGCLGTVETHPWVMLVVDLVVLAGLGFFRWRAGSLAGVRPKRARVLGQAVVICTLTSLLLALIAIWLTIEYGSVQAGVMAWRGEGISIEPYDVDLGAHPQGTKLRQTYVVRNHTDHELLVPGGKSSCRCLITENLPLRIPAHGEAEVTIVVRFVGEPGDFRQHFQLYAGDSKYPSVLGRVHGRTMPAESALAHDKKE